MHDKLLYMVIMAQPNPDGGRGGFGNIRPNWDFPGANLLQFVIGIVIAGVAVFSAIMFFVGLAMVIGGLRKGKEGVGLGLAIVAATLVVGALAVAGTNTFFAISDTIPRF